MRKVANECRMSLNTLYSIVPSKNALLLALAIHLQTEAHAVVLGQIAPTDRNIDISRRAIHASFDQFTRLPGLALAAFSAEPGDASTPESRDLMADEGLRSAPGLAPPLARDSDAWRAGRLQVLTFGWLGTTYAFSRGLLTEHEARAALDHLVDAAYSLGDPSLA